MIKPLQPLLATLLIVGLVIGVTAAPPALAHKVVVSGYAAGDVIEGEVGFSNGDMAIDTVVEVFDPDGNKLGETRTDGDGFFVYTPTQAVPHVFKADLGAGHVVEFTMAVDDLPASVTRGAGTVTEASLAAASLATAPGAIPPNGTVLPVAALPPDLSAMIAEAVRNEVRPLRREIAAYKEKNDLQAVLGGIGYILGLFGLAFFLLARRQRRPDA